MALSNRLQLACLVLILCICVASLVLVHRLQSDLWSVEGALKEMRLSLPSTASASGLAPGALCPLFVLSSGESRAIVPETVPCLLMFSTTTCIHCIRDLASLGKLPAPAVEAYLVISGSEDLPEEIPSWMKVVRDPRGTMANQHSISSFPMYVAVDAQGSIEFVRGGSLSGACTPTTDIVSFLNGR